MSKITKSAKGEECQIRLDGICNFDTSTTVFAHIGGGGMGTKQLDTEGSYACSSCHDAVDFRAPTKESRVYLRVYHHEGCMRTRKILLEKGLIKIT